MAEKHHLTMEQKITLSAVTIREAMKRGPAASDRPTAERCMIALAACDRAWLPPELAGSSAQRIWAELDEIQRGAVLMHFNSN